jgi:hypothetical protein
MMTSLIFPRQVDYVLAGKGAQDLVLGDIPHVYLPLGVPHLKLIMGHRTLHKIITKHSLTTSVIKRLPAFLQCPLMFFRSATAPGALVSMIDTNDKNGNTVIVVIHPDRRPKQHRINLIASVYGKERARWFTEQIEKGRLLYADKEKALRWSRSARLQLPGELTATRRKNTIPRNQHEVTDHRRFKAQVIPKKKGPDDEN